LLSSSSSSSSSLLGNNLKYINFKFLLFDGLTVSTWESLLCQCLCDKIINSGSSYESILWITNNILKDIVIKGGHKFNTERLFSRFYLPLIFNNSNIMLYIDNDAIITEDLSIFRNYSNILLNQTNNDMIDRKAAVGLVYDKSIFNKFYMDTHFHKTHPLMVNARKRHGDKYYYNGGVMLVDRITWIQMNLTSKAEELFIENDKLLRDSNYKKPLYDAAVGDQGVFFMMLENVAYLHPRFNMRRHPVRSISLLQDNITGIIHFAGTDGGLEALCRWPAHFPLYIKAAMPLYLTIYSSLEKTCSVESKIQKIINSNDFKNVPNMSYCGPSAVQQLQYEHKRQGIQVSYYPGKAGKKFIWPPIS